MLLARIGNTFLRTISGFTTMPGTVYYVSNDGSDNYSGKSQSAPWKTLAYASSHAVTAGDVIALKKGDIWSMGTATQINRGGTLGQPIIWDGGLWGTGSNATILGNTDVTAGNGALVHISGCSYVTFQNITVDASNYGFYGISIGADTGSFGGSAQANETDIIIQDCSILDCYKAATYTNAVFVRCFNTDLQNVTIRRNYINGASNHGIAFYPGKISDGATLHSLINMYAGYNVITNCGKLNDAVAYDIMVSGRSINATLEHNTLLGGADGYVSGAIGVGCDNTTGEPFTQYPTGLVVRYNGIRISDGGGKNGIYIQNGAPVSATVYYNKIYALNRYGIQIDAAADPSWAGVDLKFYNNTVVSDAYNTFRDQTSITSGVTIKNNIFLERSVVGNYAGMAFVGLTNYLPVHDHNLYYKKENQTYKVVMTQTADTYYTPAQITTWEATGIAVDPLLVDISSFDFGLQTDSSCINAGVDVGLTTDYAGNPIVGNPDIGCYEYIA